MRWIRWSAQVLALAGVIAAPVRAQEIDTLEAAAIAARSDDPKRQIAAAKWLQSSKPEAAAAIAILLPLLDDGSLSRQLMKRAIRDSPAVAAWRAIGSFGDAAIDPLVASFEDCGPNCRRNVVHLLGRHVDGRVTTLMRAAAIDDQDVSVRLEAAVSLAQRDQGAAIAALLPLTAQTDPGTRGRAAWALGYAAVQSEPGKPISNDLQQRAVRRLAELLSDSEDGVKGAAAEALGRVKSSNALQPLMAALEVAAIRVRVVQALGEIGDRRATSAVLGVLDDPDASTRCQTCQALGQLRDVRATKALVRLLTDPRPDVAHNAASALGAIGDRRATPALIEALQSAEELTRIEAARSLGEIRDPRALEALIAALSRRDRASNAAATALGELGDPAAIEPLARFLFATKDGDDYPVDAACGALAKIRSPRALRALAEGSIAAEKHSYATFIARRTLDGILDTHFDTDADGLARWWAEHGREFDD